MSDFCFLFLSVGNGVKMKTFSYDSICGDAPVNGKVELVEGLCLKEFSSRPNFPALSADELKVFLLLLPWSFHSAHHYAV